MSQHIKPIYGIIPVEFLRQRIQDIQGKGQIDHDFEKFISIHLGILPQKQEKIRTIAEFFLGLFLIYYHSYKLGGCQTFSAKALSDRGSPKLVF